MKFGLCGLKSALEAVGELSAINNFKDLKQSKET